jgi:Bestrophin, RFP-TM, chloride channel
LSWLKLAEVAVNPFGEDDDDFDIVELFQNHVHMAGKLLELFELEHNNPIKESLEKTNQTLVHISIFQQLCAQFSKFVLVQGQRRPRQASV